MWQVYKDKAGEWHFQLISDSGKIIMVSQGYKDELDCHLTFHRIEDTIRSSNSLKIEEVRV